MPFSGNTFARLYSWVTDAANGVKIRADRMDAEFNGIATALTQSITRGVPLTTAGTSTAYTATSIQTLTNATVYDGATVLIRPHTASGATPTIAVDTMTARAIRRQDGGQIGVNELVANGTYALTFRASDTSWYVQGAALPAIAGNALLSLRVNAAASALEFASISSAITRVARTSNTALTVSEAGNLIDITSGTFTQTFVACATLASGWFCYIRNSGTGDITLDPDASETIDGLTSFIMYPGEVRLVQCDGTALRSFVIAPFYRAFTASGTFTKPPGYIAFEGRAYGPGGGGGRSSNASGSGGGGGGGGACVPFVLLASSFGATETVTIGAGGVGGATSGTAGTAGGTTSLGTLVSAFGGGGGGTDNTTSAVPGGGGGGHLSAGQTGGITGSSVLGGLPRTSYTGQTTSSESAALGLGGGGGGGSTLTPSTNSCAEWGGGGGGSAHFNNLRLAGSSLYGAGGGAGGIYNVATRPTGGVSGSYEVGGGQGEAGTGLRAGNGGRGGSTANLAGEAGGAPGGGGGGGGTNGSSTGAGADGARGELRIWGAF